MDDKKRLTTGFSTLSTKYLNEFYNAKTIRGRLKLRKFNNIINNIPIGENDIILEIGPGPGIFTKEFIKKGASVFLFDISEDMINETKKPSET